ncbi:MAG: rod shape-determining protein MreD [Proteobacteria bacterium]|nr:rod shape-determining protein MreD [Pseudomonadota bacterium]
MDDVGRAPGIRPRPSLWRRLDVLARCAFPVTSTILLMLASNAPFGIPDQASLLPAVAVVAVFFWSVFRPSGMPPLAVFLIGLLLDLLGWLPIGTGPLCLLAVHAFCRRWGRGLGRLGFLAIWLAFAGFAIGAAAAILGLVALLDLRLMPVGPAVFQAALTVALYPVLAIPLAHAHRDLAAPERA